MKCFLSKAVLYFIFLIFHFFSRVFIFVSSPFLFCMRYSPRWCWILLTIVWTAGSKPHTASQDHLTQEKPYIAPTNVDLKKSVHHQINICTVWWIQVTVAVSTLISDITDQLNDGFYEKQIIRYDSVENTDLIDLLTIWSIRVPKKSRSIIIDSTTTWYAFQKSHDLCCLKISQNVSFATTI